MLHIELNTLRADTVPIFSRKKQEANQSFFASYQSRQYPDMTIHEVCLDANGEYEIHLPSGSEDYHIIVLDNDSTVAEITSQNGNVLIQGYVNNQVNIHSAIVAKSCVVKSQGSICFSSSIETSTHLSVEANAIYFLDKISSAESIIINAVKFLGLKANLFTKNVKINSAYIAQELDIDAETVDIQCQYYRQFATAKIQTHYITLISQQDIDLAGQLTGSKKSSLKTKVMVVGSENLNNCLVLTGEASLSVNLLLLQKNSALHIKSNQYREGNQITISERLLAYEGSVFECQNNILVCKDFQSNGKIAILDAKVKIQEMGLAGTAHFSNTDIESIGIFRYSGKAKCVFTGVRGTIEKLGGHVERIEIDHSAIHSDLVSLSSGELIADNNSSLVIKHVFTIEESASARFTQSTLTSNEFANFYGKITATNKATIKANWITSTHAGSSYDNCTVQAFPMLTMHSPTLKNGTSLSADIMELRHSLSMDNSCILSKDLSVNLDSGIIQGSTIAANMLTWKGGNQDNVVVVRSSVLNTKIFQHYGNTTLHDSFIFCVDLAKSSNSIHHHLKLVNSELQQINTTVIKEGASVNFSKHSESQGNQLVNHGNVNAENSNLHFKGLLQNNATLNLKYSQFKAENNVISSDSRTNISRAVMSCDSLIDDGVLDIDHGHLAAREVRIYNELNLSEESTVSVTREFLLMKQAKLVMDNHSLLKASKYKSYRDSTKTLKGDAHIVADEYESSGRMITIKQQMKIADIDFTRHPSLTVRHHTQFHEPATVRGDGLRIKARTLTSNADIDLGSMDMKVDVTHNNRTLKANQLSIMGKYFLNEGLIDCDNMFLGMDYAVVNYLGEINAKNAVIHGNLINYLGSIRASKQLQVSGFVNANLMGLIKANNYQENSLLSLNAGLVTPNLNASKKDIFTAGNMFSFAKTAAMIALPSSQGLINFAAFTHAQLPLLKQIPAMVKGFNWEKLDDMSPSQMLSESRNYLREKVMVLKSMRLYEVMPKVCQIKDGILLGTAAYKSSKHAYHNMMSFFEKNDTPLLPSSDKTITQKIYDYSMTTLNLATQVAPILGGNHVNNSLLHLNAGANLPLSYNETSALSVNAGILGGASSFVNTRRYMNSGIHFSSSGGVNAASCGNHGVMWMHGASINIDKFNQSGVLALNRGSVRSKQYKTKNSSHSIFREVHFDCDDTEFNGAFSSNHSVYKGKHYQLSGNHQYADGNYFEVSAYYNTASASLRDEETRVIVSSQQLDTTQSSFEGKGTVSLAYKTGDIRGMHATMDTFILETDALANQYDFIYGSGDFREIVPSKALGYKTTKHLGIENKFQDTRDCDIFLTGSGVDIFQAITSRHQISLTSTIDSINTYAELNADNIYLDSAHDIDYHGKKHTAKGKFVSSAKHDIHGKQAGFKATEICSYAGNNSYFQGSQQHATNYVQIYSVNNTYLAGVKEGDRFIATNIRSGGGVGHDDVGVYIYSENTVETGYTDIQSLGHNILYGAKGGVKLGAQVGTSTKKRKYWKKLAKIKEKTTTETAYTTKITSLLGSNYFESDDGALDTYGSELICFNGKNYAHVKGDIQQHGVVLTEKTCKNKKYVGLFSSKSKSVDESFKSDIVYDRGAIFTSEEGRYHGVGTVFGGDDKLEVNAKYGGTLTREILNHQYSENDYFVSLSMTGSSFTSHLMKGEKHAALCDLLTSDPTLESMLDYYCAETATQKATSAVNLLEDLYCDAADFAKAVNEGKVKSALWGRLGFDEDGFQPSVSATFGKHKIKHRYQSLSEGQLDKDFEFNCPEGEVTFSNAYQVNAEKGVVRAKKLNQEGAECHFSTKTKSIQFTASATGRQAVCSIGANYQQHESESTTHVNQSLKVKHLTLDLSEGEWNVHSANTEVSELVIEKPLKKLNIESEQDTAASEGYSVHADSNGMFGGSYAKSSSLMVNKVSGIRVNDKATGFSPEVLNNIGGYVSTSHPEDFSPEHTHSSAIKDKSKGYSFGTSVNLGKPSARDENRALPTITVTANYKNYKADRNAQVHSGDETINLDADVKQEIDTGDCKLKVPVSLNNVSAANTEMVAAVNNLVAPSCELLETYHLLVPQPARVQNETIESSQSTQLVVDAEDEQYVGPAAMVRMEMQSLLDWLSTPIACLQDFNESVIEPVRKLEQEVLQEAYHNQGWLGKIAYAIQRSDAAFNAIQRVPDTRGGLIAEIVSTTSILKMASLALKSYPSRITPLFKKAIVFDFKKVKQSPWAAPYRVKTSPAKGKEGFFILKGQSTLNAKAVVTAPNLQPIKPTTPNVLMVSGYFDTRTGYGIITWKDVINYFKTLPRLSSPVIEFDRVESWCNKQVFWPKHKVITLFNQPLPIFHTTFKQDPIISLLSSLQNDCYSVNISNITFLVDNENTQKALEFAMRRNHGGKHISNTINSVVELAQLGVENDQIRFYAFDVKKVAKDAFASTFFYDNGVNIVHLQTQNVRFLEHEFAHEAAHATLQLADPTVTHGYLYEKYAAKMRQAICSDYWEYNKARLTANGVAMSRTEKRIAKWLFHLPQSYQKSEWLAERIAFSFTSMTENDNLARRMMPRFYKILQDYVKEEAHLRSTANRNKLNYQPMHALLFKQNPIKNNTAKKSIKTTESNNKRVSKQAK